MTSAAIHFGSRPDPAVLEALADFICGDDKERYPVYRSSRYLTMFFRDIRIDVEHHGSTRKWWVLSVLESLEPRDIEAVVLRLVDPRIYRGDRAQLRLARDSMNEILLMEGFGIEFIQNKPAMVRLAGQDLEAMLKDDEQDNSAFLDRRFSEDIKVDELQLEVPLSRILQLRVDEVKAAPRHAMPLGSIFLLGSTLEGLLLAVARDSPQEFMSSSAAPQKKGSTKQLAEWTLAELIDVAHSVGRLSLDVKKYSHSLRDFRNYIHPHEQMSQQFEPDQRTVDISWQVFLAAFDQLKSSK